MAEAAVLLGAALLGATLVAAALLGAAEDALGVSGISMGAPASAQVFSTAAMVVSWSAALQAPFTQGCTVASSLAPCLQWQAKSVRALQPSVVRGPMKQVSCCGLV